MWQYLSCRGRESELQLLNVKKNSEKTEFPVFLVLQLVKYGEHIYRVKVKVKVKVKLAVTGLYSFILHFF